MDLQNFDLESHAMSVKGIIKLIILQISHNIFHVLYHVVHIILLCAMRPLNHGLDIRNSQNEGSTYETSTREPTLAKIESTSFIHMYFVFHSLIH